MRYKFSPPFLPRQTTYNKIPVHGSTPTDPIREDRWLPARLKYGDMVYMDDRVTIRSVNSRPLLETMWCEVRGTEKTQRVGHGEVLA